MKVDIPPRRSIIRGPKTGWIFFCTETRKKIKEENASVTFGEGTKLLSAKWKSMTQKEKEPYTTLYLNDKRRYEHELKNLSDGDRKILQQHRKRKRELRKERPSQATGAYMAFVSDVRNAIVAENPSASFEEIGKLMGERWKSMTAEDKKPYHEIHRIDKIRYLREMEQFKKKQADEKERAKKESLSGKKRKRKKSTKKVEKKVKKEE
jgi:hypothetical protein